MSENTIKDKVAIVGSARLLTTSADSSGQRISACLRGDPQSCEDAGIDVRDIDGISAMRTIARRIAARDRTGTKATELRRDGMGRRRRRRFRGGGHACAALVAGFAKYVVVFRALAQGQFGRFGQAPPMREISGPARYTAPYASSCRAMGRSPHAPLLHQYGIIRNRSRAVALAITTTRSSIARP